MLYVAGNLLKHPTDVVNDQCEACVVVVGGERVCPPYETENYKKYPVWAAAIEVIEREIIREYPIGRRPFLASHRLNGNPPLEELQTKLFGVDIVTACEISAIFHEHSNLCGPVGRWKSKMH